MLISPFQSEQAVNARFFTHVQTLSQRVYFKLAALCCFSVWEGRGRVFLLLHPAAERGEGNRDKEVALTSFSGLYRGQDL